MLKKIIILSAITCLIVNLAKVVMMASNLTTTHIVTPDMKWFIDFGALSLTSAGMNLLWVPTSMVKAGGCAPFTLVAFSVAIITLSIYKLTSKLSD